MEYPTKRVRLTPEECPEGTIIINRSGGNLLRVKKHHDGLIDFELWNGLDLAKTDGPPDEVCPDEGDLGGIEVTILDLPAKEEAPTGELSIQDVMAAHGVTLGLTPVEEELDDSVDGPVVEEPVDEPEAAPEVPPVVDPEPASVGPKPYDGDPDSNMGKLYGFVRDHGGQVPFDVLLSEFAPAAWPDDNPKSYKARVAGTIGAMVRGGYDLARYPDEVVAIGDYTPAEPVVEAELVVTEPDPISVPETGITRIIVEELHEAFARVLARLA